jgi:hypothetical protein
MTIRPQTLLLLTILFAMIAVGPIAVSSYGLYRIGASGCVLPYEPKPVPECDIAVMHNGIFTEQERYLSSLIDFGFFGLITIPLAGVPALILGVLAAERYVVLLLRKRSMRSKPLT